MCVAACLIVDLVCHTAVKVMTNKQTNKEENIKTTTQQIYKHTNKQIVDTSQAATVITKIQYKSTDAKITTVNMSFCEYLLYSTHYLGHKF